MNETIDFLSPVTSRFVIALVATVIVAYVAVRFSWGRSNRLSRAWPIYVLRGLLLLAMLSLLSNPVRVTEQIGSIKPSQVFFMLDASQSMAIGNEQATRWDQAVDLIRDASASAYETAAAEISLFRFGRRLKAVESPDALGLGDQLANDGRGVSFTQKDKTDSGDDPAAANASPASDSDTQMFVALRQISSRFGRKPPSAVVVFSDGRARDAGQAEQVATAFTKLGVPIHTVPIGNTHSGGDVALVSLVVPTTARKQSEVQAQAFLRSYGFDGKQVELKLNAIDDAGQLVKRLATIPVTLQSGFQSVPCVFRTSTSTSKLEAVVSEQPNEVSTDNNRFEAEIMISREKIRVLYVEGSRMRAVPVTENGRMSFRGPTTSLRNGLQQDVDIECRPVQVAVQRLSIGSSGLGSFPKSVAELSAFDAIILSDVPRRTFTDKQLEWIEGWVRRRGGGLCMVGGSNSFSSGNWKGSLVEKILPVQLVNDSDWRGDVKATCRPDIDGRLHPLFRLASDDALNRDVLEQFPGFHGVNAGLVPKPNFAKVLAVAYPGELAPEVKQKSPLFSAEGLRDLLTRKAASEESVAELPPEFAAITIGQYGKGRTMAMPVPITGGGAAEFLNWGRDDGGDQYYAQFWRNVIYWLTEQSYIGRRRLVAKADKRYYGPGESILLTGSAFDESANETTGYRLVGVIEPQSFDNIESDYSIVRWPNSVPREEESESPFIIWGEEFEIPVKKIAGRDVYQIDLALAETLPSGTANQSLRLELTAYEDYTQVDSTSVPIQILHDPFEQQNPFPDHELLTSLADKSGGSVLTNEDELADMLESLPIERGASEMSTSPLWSNWWALATMLGLISTEWCYRRWVGLA